VPVLRIRRVLAPRLFWNARCNYIDPREKALREAVFRAIDGRSLRRQEGAT
jgi:hypothetical protein